MNIDQTYNNISKKTNTLVISVLLVIEIEKRYTLITL